MIDNHKTRLSCLLFVLSLISVESGRSAELPFEEKDRPSAQLDLGKFGLGQEFYELPMIRFERFSEDHMECQPAIGVYSLTPTAFRVFTFKDDTRESPMSLSPFDFAPKGIGGAIDVQNGSCLIRFSVGRSELSDRIPRPLETGRDDLGAKIDANNSLPVSTAAVVFPKADQDCGQGYLTFFANEHGITYVTTFHEWRGMTVRWGYLSDDATVTETRFDRGDCSTTVNVSYFLKINGKLIQQKFRSNKNKKVNPEN